MAEARGFTPPSGKTDKVRIGASSARGRGALVLDLYMDGRIVCQHIVDFDEGSGRDTQRDCTLPLLTGYVTLKGYSRDGYDVAAVGFVACDS